eukprot:6271004-Alexandrium_andersonii.AAC.1
MYAPPEEFEAAPTSRRACARSFPSSSRASRRSSTLASGRSPTRLTCSGGRPRIQKSGGVL